MIDNVPEEYWHGGRALYRDRLKMVEQQQSQLQTISTSQDMEDAKKYNHMENVLQRINKWYVCLNQDQVTTNNQILKEWRIQGKKASLLKSGEDNHVMIEMHGVFQRIGMVKFLRSVFDKMKDTSILFKQMYEDIYHGGSYYDGLKVGDPVEYDFDFLLTLPLYSKPQLQQENPGFVQIKLTNWESFQKQPEFDKYYKEMEKLLLDEEKYLCVDKLKSWMESLLDKVFNSFKKQDNHCVFLVNDKPYYFQKRKGGPAVTLHIKDSIKDEKFYLDIDLVPCFKFQDSDWPRGLGFRQNTFKESTFFVVPKKPKDSNGSDRNWRLSFQRQESEIIGQRQSLKPALKLLKKLRDQYQHINISSYFLKTIFLWEVIKGDESFWKQNLSTVFMKMLKTYSECLNKRSIPYFWNENFNLIGDIKAVEVQNISNKITKIINEVEKKIDDPFVIASHLVPKEDLERFKKEVNVGKKYAKRSTDAVDGYCKGISNNILLMNEPLPCSSDSASLSSNDSVSNDKLASLENVLKEICRKLDQSLNEQRAIRSLLQEIGNKQDNSTRSNRPNSHPVNPISNIPINDLLSNPYEMLNVELRRLSFDSNL